MMFKTVLVALAALASVSALPFNDPRSVHTGVRVIGLSLRSFEPAPVPEIVVRGEHFIEVEKRQNIPAEFPVKSDANKQIVPYNSKRDLEVEERDFEDLEERDFEDFEERDEDDVEFAKRQGIPEELPTKAEGGRVVPYNKREEPEVPFHKRVIPSEIAVRTNEHGEIVPY